MSLSDNGESKMSPRLLIQMVKFFSENVDCSWAGKVNSKNCCFASVNRDIEKYKMTFTFFCERLEGPADKSLFSESIETVV